MALPKENTALEDFFDDLLYTGAYLAGTKLVAEHGRKVLDARRAVQTCVTTRNEKREAAVLANVKQAIAWEDVREPLESFERQADAWFDRDREGYKKVFPMTLAGMLRVPEKDRSAVFDELLRFALRVDATSPVGPSAKAFSSAWADYLAASEAAKASAADLGTAIDAMNAAKRDGIVAMREVEGQLRVAYAANPKMVKRFFRARAARAGDPVSSSGSAVTSLGDSNSG